jgi:hypothetical protein
MKMKNILICAPEMVLTTGYDAMLDYQSWKVRETENEFDIYP